MSNFGNNFGNNDLAAEYLALRAANDQLRERGRQWLWETLNRLSAEINRELAQQGNAAPLQLGRQDWEFKVETATMVGERIGLRHQYRTLLFEIGWPREPQHGFISDGGLARARVSFSQNTMIEAQPIAELILKKQNSGEPVWLLIANKKLGDLITESRLRAFLNLVLADQPNG